MKTLFPLKFKDEPNVSAIEIMEKNVKELEILCKSANRNGIQVVLYSPDVIVEPKNVYELSVMLAEDMVLKYNENNKIVRHYDECKKLA